METQPEILTFMFPDAGDIPNNPTLPLIVVKWATTLPSAEARAEFFEKTWKENRWRPAWRWGVYDFPHYHSTAHEILGVFRGRASLRLGGRTGEILAVGAGDMLILPAGTGHQNLGSSEDFQVVGGYPEGQAADLMRAKSSERPTADKRIASVPLPDADPLWGATGPVATRWLKNR